MPHRVGRNIRALYLQFRERARELLEKHFRRHAASSSCHQMTTNCDLINGEKIEYMKKNRDVGSGVRSSGNAAVPLDDMMDDTVLVRAHMAL